MFGMLKILDGKIQNEDPNCDHLEGTNQDIISYVKNFLVG